CKVSLGEGVRLFLTRASGRRVVRTTSTVAAGGAGSQGSRWLTETWGGEQKVGGVLSIQKKWGFGGEEKGNNPPGCARQMPTVAADTVCQGDLGPLAVIDG